MLASDHIPNVKLSRIRYFTDGGYYDRAKSEIKSVNASEFKTLKEKTEFVYRKARLYHKSGEVAEAKDLYNETIIKSGSEPWYFAPNACLQLGYILLEENSTEGAASYFEKALSYKRHEYKNSIDSKAKSALAKLRERSASNSN
jgi:tetratricopeptide (TPR) repeat protein